MPGVSLPVTRPTGRALLVGNPASRNDSLSTLGGLGYGCDQADDPYSAFGEICRAPAAYQFIILCLGSLYREELAVIRVIKNRFPQMEVWLSQPDGRSAAMAEGLRLGADGLLSDEGFHRIGVAPAAASDDVPAVQTLDMPRREAEMPVQRANGHSHPPMMLESPEDRAYHETVGEPILTADELRALLHEHPVVKARGD